jgi:hypothetical protein
LTSVRTTQPSFVLLDADVIIAAHELGIWEWLLHRYRIMVPSVVVRTEALFFLPAGHACRRTPIRLGQLVSHGGIQELIATASELTRVYAHFDRSFVGGLHAGETEGLALLLAGRARDAHFCSGDKLAIQALGMLGLSEHGIALETLLGGKQHKGVLEVQFTEVFLRRNLSRGLENRITGMGLNRGLLD